MIRIYCQYSYGGFKTFFIEGKAHEELNRIVTADNNYGLTDSAGVYFNRGGVKMLYRYIDSDKIALLIKEIPGHNTDSDGRAISSAVLFIGDLEDRKTMDRMAIRITNNLSKFENDFADMFDLRDGLHFDGDKLSNLITECEKECSYNGASKLLNIRNRKGNILLFVPFSDHFDTDMKVQNKTLTELQLPLEATDSDRHMSILELEKLQYALEEVPLPQAQDTDHLPKSRTKEDLELELAEEKKKSAKRLEDLTQEKEKYAIMSDRKNKLIYILAGILGFSLFIHFIKLFF